MGAPTLDYKCSYQIQSKIRVSVYNEMEGEFTCLGGVLALRPTPGHGAGALVLLDPLHAGTPILAGVTPTLAQIWGGMGQRRSRPLMNGKTINSGRWSGKPGLDEATVVH